MIELQIKQSKIDEFQLYFIQIKQDLKIKIAQGSIDSPSETIKNALAQYDNIKSEYKNPTIHLKVIEIIRAEYILNRKFNVFADVVQKYYNEVGSEIFEDETHINTFAQIEYIMSYTFLNTRNFKKSLFHLSKLTELMLRSDIVNLNYQGKYIAIQSFIQVFNHQINEAIESIKSFLLKEKNKISIQEYLNLSLNLSGYLITVGSYSKAIKILNFMSESDKYYQKEMGREWLIRKEMIFCIIQTSLGNTELSLKRLSAIEKKHSDMLSIDQYSMVSPFIHLIRNYIKNPQDSNIDNLVQFENSIGLNKEKVFRDPRLIIFYAWLRSQYVKKGAYDVLMDEYLNIE